MTSQLNDATVANIWFPGEAWGGAGGGARGGAEGGGAKGSAGGGARGGGGVTAVSPFTLREQSKGEEEKWRLLTSSAAEEVGGGVSCSLVWGGGVGARGRSSVTETPLSVEESEFGHWKE